MIFFGFLFILFPLISSLTPVIVKTSFGRISGFSTISNNRKTVHIFKGIPFAAPPVGNLRFEKPILPQKWNFTRDATQYSAACASNASSSSSPQKFISEDCLYLNIFAGAKCTSTNPCPVVFYIHGGGAFYDSAVMFDDIHLINNFGAQDLIFVIPAFRLGIFSHLTFNDVGIVPKNLAIFDILMAMEYVQHDIHLFGGDKKQITLMGHSYGASTVLYMIFSDFINTDKRFFQKAIAMSPSGAFRPPEDLEAITWKFVERLKCGKYTSSNAKNQNYLSRVISCMKRIPTTELLAVQRNLEEMGEKLSHFIRGLPTAPDESLASFIDKPLPLPLIIGTTSHELDHLTDKYPERMGNIIPFDNPVEVNAKYVKDLKDPNRVFNHSIASQEFYTGVYQYGHAMRAAGGKTWLYSYDDPHRPYHCDDLCYILGIHCTPLNEDEKYLERIYPKFFTNFIKTGVPHPEWKTLEENVDNYYSIDYDVITGKGPIMKKNYEYHTIKYWFDEMKKYDASITMKGKINNIKWETRDASVSNTTILERSGSTWVNYVIGIYSALIIFAAGALVGAFMQFRHFTIRRGEEMTALIQQ